MTCSIPAAIAALTETSPCDDCPKAKLCQDEGMACAVFGLYLEGEPWASLPRVPLYTIAVDLDLGG